MLPADTPKLAKWPFLVGDATLLGVAWLVASQTRAPLTGGALVAVVLCVAAGAILGVVPFISDYARKQDEALDERQRSLESLSRTVAASAEQIGIAANGLHEIAASARQNLKSAEELTAALKSVASGAVGQSDSQAVDMKELKETVEKAAKAAHELTRIESTAQKHFSAAVDTLAKTTAAIETLNSRVASKSIEVSQPPRSAPAISVEPFQGEPPVTPAEVAAAVDALAGSAEIPAPGSAEDSTPGSAEREQGEQPITPAPEKPKRARKPRAPKVVEPSGSEAAGQSGNETATAVLEEAVPADDLPASGVAPQLSEVVERVRTSDGATRLIVTAYIGIGNRLFIRGEGPGLSWDAGVPMQFVSIGRWRWESADATAPVKFKLYKNDTAECTSLGEQSIDSGQQEEITALF